MLFVANGQASELIQPTKEAFDLPASPSASQRPPGLDRRFRPVLFVGSDPRDPSLVKACVKRITVIRLVSDQASGKWMNEAGSQRGFHERDVMWRRRGQVDGDRQTSAVCHCQDFRPVAPLGGSHPVPPFWAITKVPSIKPSERSRPPRSRTSSANAWTCSSTPERTQCWNRRWQVWYGGYRVGRSCHRAPVFKTQRMPLRTARVSCQGRPRPSGRRRGAGIRGCKSAHCSSVKSTVHLRVESLVKEMDHLALMQFQGISLIMSSNRPDMITYPCRHSRSCAKRLMNAAEVVVHRVHSNSMNMVLNHSWNEHSSIG